MHRKLPDAELKQPSKNSQKAESRPLRCAKCGQDYMPNAPEQLPFCSLRCQQMDLAGWLDEENGLPFEGDKTGQIIDNGDKPTE